MSSEQVPEVERRVGVDAVDPDVDVFDDRGMPGLAKIGRAGEQRHRAVGLDDQRLEETIAEGVVAGQPVHAFLGEEQHGVELFVAHLVSEAREAAGEFGSFEMQCHSIKSP